MDRNILELSILFLFFQSFCLGLVWPIVPDNFMIQRVDDGLFTHQSSLDEVEILDVLNKHPLRSPAAFIDCLYKLLTDPTGRSKLSAFRPFGARFQAYASDALPAKIMKKRKALEDLLDKKNPSEHEAAISLYRELAGLLHEEKAWSEVIKHISKESDYMSSFLDHILNSHADDNDMSRWPDTLLHPDFYTHVNVQHFSLLGVATGDEGVSLAEAQDFLAELDEVEDKSAELDYFLRSRNLIKPLYRLATDDALKMQLVPLKRYLVNVQQRMDYIRQGIIEETLLANAAICSGQQATTLADIVQYQDKAWAHGRELQALQTELMALDQVCAVMAALPVPGVSLRHHIRQRIHNGKQRVEAFQNAATEALTEVLHRRK